MARRKPPVAGAAKKAPALMTPQGAPAGAKRVAEYREVTQKVVSLLSEKKINVTQRGITAYVKYAKDGSVEVLNLPYIPDEASEELLSAIRGFLDHEVAHVLFTDHHAVKSVFDRVPEEDQKMVHSFWNMLEDTRIERCMRERFPGSGANLSYLTRFVSDRLTIPMVKAAKEAGDDKAIINAGIVSLFYAWAGDDESARVVKEMDLENLVPQHITALEEFKPHIPTLGSTLEAGELAHRIFIKLKAASAPPPPPPPPAPPAEEEEEDDQDQDSDDDAPQGNNGSSDDQDPGEQSDQPDPGNAGEGDGEDDAEGQEQEPDASDDHFEADDQDQGDDQDDGEGGDHDDDQPQDDDLQDDEPKDDPGIAGEDDSYDSSDKPESDQPSEQEDDGDNSKSGGDGPTGSGTGSNEQDTPEEPDEDAAQDEVPQDIALELMDGMGEEREDLANVISVMCQEGIRNDTYLPYTTDFDVTMPVPVPEDIVSKVDHQLIKLDEKIRHMVGQMQASMRRLFAQQDLIANQAGLRSGRLDASNLYRLRVGDDRVFSRREEHHATDTAVTLLIDCSGSMMGQKMLLACQAAYALSQTLDRINIVHEILGFTTAEERAPYLMHYVPHGDVATQQAALGRDFSRLSPITIYEFKRFEERTSIETKRRMVAAPGAWSTGKRSAVEFEPQVKASANVDGESLLMAARRLSKRREPRKILMVLSDGQPSAIGEDADLQAHLKFAVKECERQHIETLGIGIMDSAVRSYYPKCAVISNVEELPTAVVGELSKFLLGAGRKAA